MMFGGRNQFQHRAELDVFLRPDLRVGDFVSARRQSGDGAEFIADKDRFERDRRLGALMGGNVRVQRRNDFVGGRLFVRQIGCIFEDFADHRHAGFQTFRRAKIRQQPVLQRRFLFLKDDRFGLFQRHDEMPVLLHFAPGGFPPLPPVIANDIGHQRLLDLVRRCLAAVAVQHQLDQIQVPRGHLVQALEVHGLARQDMILGNRLQRFGGERQIHRVSRLARKINGEPREHRVHRLNPAEPPTAVHAKTAGGQLRQRLDVAAFNLARGSQFLKFLSHKSIVFIAL